MGAWLMVSIGCAGNMAPMQPPTQSTSTAAAVFDQTSGEEQKGLAVDPVASADGSLWRDDAPMMVLFSDIKARSVGDIVTIKIVESSDATNQAATATGRNSSLSASIDGFFNLEKDFPPTRSFFNPFSKVAGGLESKFKGSGTTTRSGDLNAYITCVVTRILPNGNLVLTGTREVLVNNENQVIELTGIVRSRDINANNQVLSTYVADARISYDGKGIIDERQQPGWLTSIVMTVWPF
jgi:flagellar L-ring protein precursor FlgH